MSWFSWPWTLFSAYLVVELFSRGAVARFFLRQLGLGLIHMELAAVALMKRIIRPRYVLTGRCHKCGDCCRQLLADPPDFVKRNDIPLRLFLAFHAWAHNFHVVARGPHDEIIFACGHLHSDGRCSIYRRRPLLCRNYPVVPFYDPPVPLPGCGFGVAARVVIGMRRRPNLPVVNPHVGVHHPTPSDRDEAVPEHFHFVELD